MSVWSSRSTQDDPPNSPTSDSKLDLHLCLRTQTQSQCLVPVQSQTPSLAYHLSRYPSFNEQHATKEAFYSHHHPAGPYSSLSTKPSLASYGPPVRPASSYSSGSDPVQSEQGLGTQAAAQILDPAEGFVFMGAGLNTPGGGCQAHPYSAAGHSGNSVFLLLETFCCFVNLFSVFLWLLWTPRCNQPVPPLPVSGYYGHSGYLDSQRMASLVDQHVSVISTVSSLRPFPSVYSEVHDPLNILDEPGRKTTGAYFTESEPGTGQQVSQSNHSQGQTAN